MSERKASVDALFSKTVLHTDLNYTRKSSLFFCLLCLANFKGSLQDLYLSRAHISEPGLLLAANEKQASRM